MACSRAFDTDHDGIISVEEVKVRRCPCCYQCAAFTTTLQAKVAEFRDEKKKSDSTHLLNR